ncbi:MAG: dihydrodipicolinate synthase family protein [Chloroflexota bacterium]
MPNNLSPHNTPYHGVVVPMITPVTPAGDLDEPAVRRVIDYLIRGGVNGIFILGTTGEAASVPPAMRLRLAALTIEQTAGRAMVYAGISHNCLANSVEAAQAFFQLGVDVVVAHLPSYYDLNPAEQEAYYLALSRRIDGPLMLYNIPSTTHMSLPIEVIARLSKQPNIVGLKDSENNPTRLTQVMETLGGRPDFAILTGVTALSAQALWLGAHGTVPSLGNLAPGLCQKLYDRVLEGCPECVAPYQQQLDELGRLVRGQLSLGQSLGALKAVMGALSLCGPDMLPPLQALDQDRQAQIQQQFIAWQSQL